MRRCGSIQGKRSFMRTQPRSVGGSAGLGTLPTANHLTFWANQGATSLQPKANSMQGWGVPWGRRMCFKPFNHSLGGFLTWLVKFGCINRSRQKRFRYSVNDRSNRPQTQPLCMSLNRCSGFGGGRPEPWLKAMGVRLRAGPGDDQSVRPA